MLCAFKVHNTLVSHAHLLVLRKAKTTSSLQMISVTRTCAKLPVAAHKIIIAQYKKRQSLSKLVANNILVIFRKSSTKLISESKSHSAVKIVSLFLLYVFYMGQFVTSTNIVYILL